MGTRKTASEGELIQEIPELAGSPQRGFYHWKDGQGPKQGGPVGESGDEMIDFHFVREFLRLCHLQSTAEDQ